MVVRVEFGWWDGLSWGRQIVTFLRLVVASPCINAKPHVLDE